MRAIWNRSLGASFRPLPDPAAPPASRRAQRRRILCSRSVGIAGIAGLADAIDRCRLTVRKESSASNADVTQRGKRRP
jgi:hypothetical protein